MPGFKCPSCGKDTYYTWAGRYEGMKKIEPDWSECSNCGFAYSEHVKHDEDKLAEEWRERHKK